MLKKKITEKIQNIISLRCSLIKNNKERYNIREEESIAAECSTV